MQTFSPKDGSGSVYMILIFIAIILALYLWVTEPEPVLQQVEYTVTAGDTLWQLAERYAPESMSYNEYIFKVRQVNELEEAALWPGQTIIILKEEG